MRATCPAYLTPWFHFLKSVVYKLWSSSIHSFLLVPSWTLEDKMERSATSGVFKNRQVKGSPVQLVLAMIVPTVETRTIYLCSQVGRLVLEVQNLLGCTAVFLIECRPTFQRCVLPPSSGSHDLGSTHFWNVGRHPIKNTAVHPRRFWTSCSPPWELGISQRWCLFLLCSSESVQVTRKWEEDILEILLTCHSNFYLNRLLSRISIQVTLVV
jgi:hypothetical protein